MRVAVMPAPGEVRIEHCPEPKIIDPTDAIIRLPEQAARPGRGADRVPYRGIRRSRRAAVRRLAGQPGRAVHLSGSRAAAAGGPEPAGHSESALLFEATKHVLAMKLGRVGLHHAWSDRPSGTMRHFIGGVRVFDLPNPAALRVDSNVLATFSRGRDETELATAGRQDIITVTGDEYRLLRRRVLLDVEVATWTQLSIIF